MQTDLSGAFDALMNFEMWQQIAVILVAFLAPQVARNVLSSHVPNKFDVPEAYGLLVVVGGQFSPMYSNEISLGGGLYVADSAAERVGIRSSIVNAGA
jgi:hypothetical protein